MRVGMIGAWLVGAMLLSVPVAGAESARAKGDRVEPATAASPVLDDRYPRVVVNFDEGVESFPDLIYSTLPGFRPLRLDLYKPRHVSQDAGLPLVLYVHGGGWQSGHTRHSGAFANWPAVLASLAARGYVVASIEYRLSSEARFPAAIQDVKTSIRWLRSRSAEFGIDRTRAVIWGGSAGGQLAALAATSCGDDALAPSFAADSKSPAAVESDCVQGLVAWYGVFDFATVPPLAGNQTPPAESPVSKYLGCQPANCAATVALASPVTHIDARTPSTLLIHGELDEVVPVAQSRAFHAALLSRKVGSELMVIPGVDHSFIGPDEATTRGASLAALSRTFAFIDATLRGTHP